MLGNMHAWKYVKLSAVNTCMILSMHVKPSLCNFDRFHLTEKTKAQTLECIKNKIVPFSITFVIMPIYLYLYIYIYYFPVFM